MYLTKTSVEMTCPQPPPVEGTGDAWREAINYAQSFLFLPTQVLEDMEARRQFGIDKYDTPLQFDNGRDYHIDAYQEALDKFVYYTGCIRGAHNDDRRREVYRWLRRNCLQELAILRTL